MKTLNQRIASWLINDFAAICKRNKVRPQDSGVPPEDFGMVVKLVHIGMITKEQAREMLENRVKKEQK